MILTEQTIGAHKLVDQKKVLWRHANLLGAFLLHVLAPHLELHVIFNVINWTVELTMLFHWISRCQRSWKNNIYIYIANTVSSCKEQTCRICFLPFFKIQAFADLCQCGFVSFSSPSWPAVSALAPGPPETKMETASKLKTRSRLQNPWELQRLDQQKNRLKPTQTRKLKQNLAFNGLISTLAKNKNKPVWNHQR